MEIQNQNQNQRKQRDVFESACVLILEGAPYVSLQDLIDFSAYVTLTPVLELCEQGRHLSAAFSACVCIRYISLVSLHGGSVFIHNDVRDVAAFVASVVSKAKSLPPSNPLHADIAAFRQELVTITMAKIDMAAIRTYVEQQQAAKSPTALGRIVEVIGANMADIEDVAAWDTIIAIARAAQMLLEGKNKKTASK